jgi:uncharacterized membrane protein (UPF0127 family)
MFLDTLNMFDIILPGNRLIYTYVASDIRTQIVGLTQFDSLNMNEGMFFIYSTDSNHPIWMKYMKMPIDILWLNSDKEIIHIIQNAQPWSGEAGPIYGDGFISKYVLELKNGAVKHFNLKPGDKIDF